MSERARIGAWWGYVLCVVVIFEIAMQVAGFAVALAVALVTIAVLGTILKLVVARLTRRGPVGNAPRSEPEPQQHS